MKSILLVIVFFGLFVGCLGPDYYTCDDGTVVTDATECPTPTPTATPIPGLYEDENLRIYFPAWSTETVLGTNDFFTMNHEEKRSYAFNYISEGVTAEAAENHAYSMALGCLQEMEGGGDCIPTDPLESGEFWIFCKASILSNDAAANTCYAATVCNDNLITISVIQETDAMELPVEEYIDVLDSMYCKDALPL